jgi:DNA repair protein RecN (Recombination protein N)
MLRRLSARNYALIAETEVEFQPGLNLLTGETGAGKSILIGALGFALGAREDASCVRTGEEAARVEAEFELDPYHRVFSFLEGKGLPREGNLLTVKREMSAAGRGRVWVNGESAPLGVLAGLAVLLVDFHGQHEQQSLLRIQAHLDLLDRYAGLETEREALGQLVGALNVLKEKRRALDLSAQERERQLDLLQYQVKELAQAGVKPGEREALRQEKALLASAEKRAQAVSGALESLRGSADQPGALDGVGAALRPLKNLTGLDAAVGPLQERLKQNQLELEDLVRELSDYEGGISFDPARMEAVEDRLALFEKLSRKYGPDETAMLAWLAEAQDKVGVLSGSQEKVGALDLEIREAAKRCGEAAFRLSQKRQTAAKKFSSAVSAELAGLGMDKAVFAVSLALKEEPQGLLEHQGRRYACGPEGVDQVEFLLSANAGEAPRPLIRIASGGELSRVMLAIKSVLFALDPLDTLVFDEVDNGISGRVAQAVAEKLSLIASRRQVLCITHLPQIACRPSVHFKAGKEVKAGKTYTRIQALSGQERIAEVAALLDGTQVTDSGLAHARLLMEAASKGNR